MSHCTKQEQTSAEQISMTGNKFLNWFERWSMDGLCESSFRPQLGVMRVHITDVNARLSKTAPEGLADMNAHSSIRSDHTGRSGRPKRMLEEVGTGRGATGAN
jgi:hypothetical protein